jgi:hypothetical protein
MLTEVGLDQQSSDPQLFQSTHIRDLYRWVSVCYDTRVRSISSYSYSTPHTRLLDNDIIQLLLYIQSLEIIQVLDIIKTLQKYNVLTTYKY